MATAGTTTSEDDEGPASSGFGLVASNRLHSSLLLAAHNNNYHHRKNAGMQLQTRPIHSDLLQLARSLELGGGTVSDSDFLVGSTTRSLSGRPVRLVMEQQVIHTSGSTRLGRQSRSVSPRSTHRYQRHLVQGRARGSRGGGTMNDNKMGMGLRWRVSSEKGKKASYARSRAKSPSSESDTSSMVSTPGFVDYLNTLSECPDIDRQSGQVTPSRKPIHVQLNRRDRAVSECETLPRRKKPQGSQMSPILLRQSVNYSPFVASESDTGTETMISDFESGGTISEDSLNNEGVFSPGQEQILSQRLHAMAFQRFTFDESDTSFASSALQIRPSRKVYKKKRHKSKRQQDQDLKSLELELKSLEDQLSFSEKRGHWEEQIVNSWSTEFFGNFTDNEKVRFSYESLVGGNTSSVLPSPSPLTSVIECPVPQSKPLDMPEPVQSLLRHFTPVQSNAPHERFSPKPVRRFQNLGAKKIASSPSTPTSEFKPFPGSIRFPRTLSRAFSDPRGNSSSLSFNRCKSLTSDLTGAIGMTSMWIPVSQSVPRRFSSHSNTPFRPLTDAQSHLIGGGLSLAKRVLLQNALLPNKSEG